MTLSLFLLLLLLLLRIPACLLPRNRLKVYLYSALFSCFVLGRIGIIDRVGETKLEEKRGLFFSPLFSHLVEHSKGLTEKEGRHIYCYLANLLVYGMAFFLSFPLFSIFFIGNNPSIYQPAHIPVRVFLSLAFLLSTYGFFSFTLINIRRIIPFPYGIREGVFNRFYPIGA